MNHMMAGMDGYHGQQGMSQGMDMGGSMGMMNGTHPNMGHHGMMQQQQMGVDMPGGGMGSMGGGMGMMGGALNSGLCHKIRECRCACALRQSLMMTESRYGHGSWHE